MAIEINGQVTTRNTKSLHNGHKGKTTTILNGEFHHEAYIKLLNSSWRDTQLKTLTFYLSHFYYEI